MAIPTPPTTMRHSLETRVLSIDTNRVRPFADQPREYFDAGELISLELSIKQRAQLQPAMVRKLTDDRDHDYELVDGQRRWHACSRLGVPLRAVIIDPENPEDQYEISVAANFQRAGHTPMEIAKAIERMCTQGKRTEEYVATLFGKSGWWVSTQRSLNKLVPEIQAQLEPAKDPLPVAIGVRLARLPKELQLSMLEEIRARGLNAARVADKVRRMLLDAAGEPERRKKPSSHAANIQSFVRQTIQRADMALDRMGPDDFRTMVDVLSKNKTFDQLKESVMTAIGRLEVLHRRLTECRASISTAPVPVMTKPSANPGPLRGKTVTVPNFTFSHEMTCPKCKSTRVRFKRSASANLQRDFWTCPVKGCQLKISHYSIKVDTKYEGAAAHG